MDFSKVKEWFIPEGKVKSVSVGGVVIWKAEAEVVEQLTAPTISLDGDTLTITATDNRTEEFVIFVDGVEKAVVKNLISFTIDGTQYTALSGMTWGEWVASAYNTGGYAKHPNLDAIRLNTVAIVYNNDGSYVKKNDKIINGRSYVHGEYNSGAGGSN